MKKIIALALAASMLSTSALALTYERGNKNYSPEKDGNAVNLGGVKAKFDVNDFRVWEEQTVNGKKEMVLGGSTLKTLDVQPFQFNADNFTVTYKVSKGASLVKKPTFVDGNLVLEISSQTVKEINNKVPDVVVDYVEVRAKRPVKDVIGKETLVKTGTKFRVDLTDTALDTKTDSFVIAQSLANSETIDEFNLEAGTNKVEIKKGSDDTMKKDVELYADDYTVTTRVFVGDVLTFKTDAPKAEVLTALYANNLDADLDTHTFVVDGFRAAVNVKLSVNPLGDVEPKDQVLYFMDETGKLTACNWKYNADENVFEGKLPNGTTTIVNASKALKAAPVASSNEDKKPEDTKKPAVPETGLVVNVDAAIVK